MALKCKCHLDENRAYHLDKRNQQIFLRETEQECGGFTAMPRPFQHPPGNSRFALFLPASEVSQRVEIAESPVKCAFRGVRPHPFTDRITSTVSQGTLADPFFSFRDSRHIIFSLFIIAHISERDYRATSADTGK
jgi:hypothetical protein